MAKGKLGMWQAISLDGYVKDGDKLRKGYKLIAGADASELYGLEDKMSQIYAYSLHHYNDIAQAEGKSQMTPNIVWHNFILEIQEGHPILPPYTHLYDEFLKDSNRDSYFHFITIHDCREDGSPVVEHFAEETAFRIKTSKEYDNCQKFKRRCLMLLDEILDTYAAPSLVFEHKLAGIGFGEESAIF